LTDPEPLGPQRRLEGFECDKPTLNDWLVRHAGQAQGSGSAKTFAVSEDDRVAGYYSLTVGQIDALDAPERIRQGVGQYPTPAVPLVRLGVRRQNQGRGIGVGLLQDAIRRTLMIAEQAGIRAMLPHPIDEAAARFYTRFGFTPRPCASGNSCCYSRMPAAGSSAPASSIEPVDQPPLLDQWSRIKGTLIATCNRRRRSG
jgi:GNAT superfamily N-acetyltransferase